MNYTNTIFTFVLVCFLMRRKRSEPGHMQVPTAQIIAADLAIDTSWVMVHSNKGMYVKYATVNIKSLLEPYNHAPAVAAHHEQFKRQPLLKPVTHTGQLQECIPKKYTQLARSQNAMTLRLTPGKGTFLPQLNDKTPYNFPWIRKQHVWPAAGSGSAWISCLNRKHLVYSAQSAIESIERQNVALSKTKLLKIPVKAVNMKTTLENFYQSRFDNLKLTSSSLIAVQDMPPNSKILRQNRLYPPESATRNPHPVSCANRRSDILNSLSST